jgi:hypothetical protein
MQHAAPAIISVRKQARSHERPISRRDPPTRRQGIFVAVHAAHSFSRHLSRHQRRQAAQDRLLSRRQAVPVSRQLCSWSRSKASAGILVGMQDGSPRQAAFKAHAVPMSRHRSCAADHPSHIFSRHLLSGHADRRAQSTQSHGQAGSTGWSRSTGFGRHLSGQAGRPVYKHAGNRAAGHAAHGLEQASVDTQTTRAGVTQHIGWSMLLFNETCLPGALQNNTCGDGMLATRKTHEYRGLRSRKATSFPGASPTACGP